MRRAARILGFAIAPLSLVTLIGVYSGTALGTSQAQNTAPDTPSNLATEFPQAEPVLHATFSDLNGGQGQVLYMVYDLSTGGIVLQDAPGPSVASGSDSPYTIPTGTLVDGVTYKWTARSFDGSAYSAATTEPDFVATSDSSTSSLSPTSGSGVQAATANPWGCLLDADQPHASAHQKKFIAAHSQVACTSLPPGGMWIKQDQNLYRSSYTGWRFVAENVSYCTSRNHSSGQDAPVCRPGDYVPMEAWVHWNCVDAGFKNQWYNYRQEDSGEIRSGGVSYFAYDAAQSGDWNANGTVKCGLYL